MFFSRKSQSCAVSVFLTSSLFSGASEEAKLQVTISPGSLEIAPSSVIGPHTPTSGAVSVTGAYQADRVTFEIPDIVVNDLNGDSLGWRITATPGDLSNGFSTMPVGTVAGFLNPSDETHTSIESANSVLFASGVGIANYTIDYHIAYDVPQFADVGEYTGSITFSIVAE